MKNKSNTPATDPADTAVIDPDVLAELMAMKSDPDVQALLKAKADKAAADARAQALESTKAMILTTAQARDAAKIAREETLSRLAGMVEGLPGTTAAEEEARAILVAALNEMRNLVAGIEQTHGERIGLDTQIANLEESLALTLSTYRWMIKPEADTKSFSGELAELVPVLPDYVAEAVLAPEGPSDDDLIDWIMNPPAPEPEIIEEPVIEPDVEAFRAKIEEAEHRARQKELEAGAAKLAKERAERELAWAKKSWFYRFTHVKPD